MKLLSIELIASLCFSLSIVFSRMERRTFENQKTAACPHGIVYRAGCEFCYCIEEAEEGIVRHKCISKYTSERRCAAMSRRSHCRPHRLLYDYRSECEGKCWCNKARNLTTCENLPCDNAMLLFLGYYDDESDTAIRTDFIRSDAETEGSSNSEGSPKITFHGRRLRREGKKQEKDPRIGVENDTCGNLPCDKSLLTYLGYTEESDFNDTVSWSFPDYDETTPEEGGGTDEKVTTLGKPKTKPSGVMREAKTSEATDSTDDKTAGITTATPTTSTGKQGKVTDTSTDAKGTTSTDGKGTTSTDGKGTTSTDGKGTTSTDGKGTTSPDEKGKTSTDGKGTGGTGRPKEGNTTDEGTDDESTTDVGECDGSTTDEDDENEDKDEDCDTDSTDNEDDYDTDRTESEPNSTDHRRPENTVSERCPWGIYQRIGCRVCYCFTPDEAGPAKTFCYQDLDYEMCNELAPKVHCEEINLLYDYNRHCEGPCKCECHKPPKESVTICAYLPCNDRMLREHGYYD